MQNSLMSFLFECEVESYNPLSNKWTSFPSLRRKKGNLAAVSFHDKIYAIGGGNGFESLSEMDMYLLDIGMWISTQSMLHKVLKLRLVLILLLHDLNGTMTNKNSLNILQFY